jgi:hypothetical protein
MPCLSILLFCLSDEKRTLPTSGQRSILHALKVSVEFPVLSDPVGVPTRRSFLRLLWFALLARITGSSSISVTGQYSGWMMEPDDPRDSHEFAFH